MSLGSRLHFEELSIPGAQRVEAAETCDARGTFVKLFHAEAFRSNGIELEMRESFLSTSGLHVLRGMHVQLPPSPSGKLVWCVQGAITDVLLDLRASSPTFGRHVAISLAARRPMLVYVPRGVAHGFLSLEQLSMVQYWADAVFDPGCDGGIAWDSFGFDWGCAAPVLSDRDRALPALADFVTPF